MGILGQTGIFALPQMYVAFNILMMPFPLVILQSSDLCLVLSVKLYL